MPRIAIILPAYNEERTLAQTIRAFHEVLPEAELVVVDNNSSDRTAALARAEIRACGGRGRVISEHRQGKGFAVRRAFVEVSADAYLLVDADLTYPPERAPDLLRPILDGEADMVVGDRISGGEYERENKRPFHGIGNHLVRWLVRWIFGARLADVMSGYRALSRVFVKNYPILIQGFELETDMTLHALRHRFRVLELPVRYRDRPAGSESKLNTFSDGARVLFTITQVLRYYRPLAFFGTFALLSALASIAAGWAPVDEFLVTRYITHVPLAILASGLAIVALTSLGIGLTLDVSRRHEDARYEHELIKFFESHATAEAAGAGDGLRQPLSKRATKTPFGAEPARPAGR